MTAKGRPLSPQTFQALLRNPLYAGWVTLPSDESFEPVRGLHEPIISQDKFDQVQAILEGRKPSAAPKRKFNPALPLKCFIRCETCGSPLTGGNAKGRNKKYPRYWCRTKGCRAVKLSGAQLENEFLAYLNRLKPHADTISSFPKVAATVWAEKRGDSERDLTRLSVALNEQKNTKSGLIRMRMHDEITLADFNEAKADCEKEIARIESKVREINSRRADADSFVRFAELQLVDIAKIWQIAGPEARQRVQNLLFQDGLQYSSQSGILNRSKSCLFSVLEATKSEIRLLASPTGFEPVLSP
jgi:site-specific DNA recombinase